MLAGRPSLVSEADFLELPPSMDKIELLDGEVLVARAPSLRHQDILRRFITALSNWVGTQGEAVFVGQAPIDIRFGENRILQPDAFVILGSVDLSSEGPLDRIPDICIEVLSQRRAYDRITERYVYADAGVREYSSDRGSGN